jgi:hypothetical protein
MDRQIGSPIEECLLDLGSEQPLAPDLGERALVAVAGRSDLDDGDVDAGIRDPEAIDDDVRLREGEP